MPAPARTTRRAPASASARFLASRRGRPVGWLVGGIGAAFALALAFVLLGGSPPVDTLPDQVAELETRSRTAEAEGRLEEAVRGFQKLLELAQGREDFRVRAIEWRAAIKSLEAEKVEVAKADAAFAAFEKETRAALLSADPATIRAAWEKGSRLRSAYADSKRPWLKKLDALLAALEAGLPKPKPSPPSVDVHVQNRAWSTAARILKDYLGQDVEPSDRQKAENLLRTVEQKAKDEADSLTKRGLSADELRKHLPRFQGTAAEALLRKALEGK